MRYQVIVSDPPWAFGDRLQRMKAPTKRSAASQYKTMSTHEIAALSVPSIVDPDGCVQVLWVPATLLKDGLYVLEAWGFDYKGMFKWVKVKKPNPKKRIITPTTDLNDFLAFGMGRLFRQCSEVALIGTTGKVYKNLVSKSERDVIFDYNRGHSVKPEGLQDKLERMFPSAKKMELFARRCRQGWATVGDAVTGKDIRESLVELSTL